MTPKLHPGFAARAFVVGSAIVAAVVIHRIGTGGVVSPGRRLLALLVGVVIFAIGAVLLRRAARRRADLAALRDLLPRHIQRRQPWATGSRSGRGIVDPFLLDGSESGEDLSDRIPVARAEIRAATRALLFSLEEEMDGEIAARRRHARPACRRARLRAAGRSKTGRRRAPPRPAAIPS